MKAISDAYKYGFTRDKESNVNQIKFNFCLNNDKSWKGRLTLFILRRYFKSLK